MAQLPSGPRRTVRPSVDVYTALALAGAFALIIAVAILWIKGTDLAGDQASHPFTIMNQ